MVFFLSFSLASDWRKIPCLFISTYAAFLPSTLRCNTSYLYNFYFKFFYRLFVLLQLPVRMPLIYLVYSAVFGLVLWYIVKGILRGIRWLIHRRKKYRFMYLDWEIRKPNEIMGPLCPKCGAQVVQSEEEIEDKINLLIESISTQHKSHRYHCIKCDFVLPLPLIFEDLYEKALNHFIQDQE